MVTRVLIANRGEIALRILRACRELGIATVAVYSKVDANLHYLNWADDTVCISDRSYLAPESIVGAALSRQCDAVHPGYGLLSENADFVRQVEINGLKFIGPAADTIAAMGDKVVALNEARKLGLPVGPETRVPETADEAMEVAAELGYPVLLKAAHGGGGRGMRVAKDEHAVTNAFVEAQNESLAAFGSGEIYVEKYVTNARHVEVQVMGDGQGSAIHLGTRDCSVQRRHQKLIEEAPAPGIDEAKLDALAQSCSRAAAKVKYRSAGTFEFLYAGDKFQFIEMNTRIQVEHPVTESLTGIDIVKLQLEIAMTGKLPMSQEDVVQCGHAIECRINAEAMDSEGNTIPQPGLVWDHVVPGGPGVRVDSHLVGGYVVPHEYDSLVSKITCWGRDRNEARVRALRALSEFRVRGIETNQGLLASVLESKEFIEGQLNTQMLVSRGKMA